MKRSSANVDDWAKLFYDDAIYNWRFNLNKLAEKVESPIELLLGAHMLMICDGYDWVTFDPNFSSNSSVTIFDAQVPLGQYRVDFLFACQPRERRKYLVVECDGHDFHERTKEQAARDRSRDRFFSKQGITTLRFTGSEIWRDPRKCADEVSDQLYSIVRELSADRRGVAS